MWPLSARLRGDLGHRPRGRRAVHRGPAPLQPHRAGHRLPDGGRGRQDPAGAPGRAGESDVMAVKSPVHTPGRLT